MDRGLFMFWLSYLWKESEDQDEKETIRDGF